MKMIVGNHYNWKNQPDRLIYLGEKWYTGGSWHQFKKIGDDRPVWCEVREFELEYFEESTTEPVPDPTSIDVSPKKVKVIGTEIEEWNKKVDAKKQLKKQNAKSV